MSKATDSKGEELIPLWMLMIYWKCGLQIRQICYRKWTPT